MQTQSLPAVRPAGHPRRTRPAGPTVTSPSEPPPDAMRVRAHRWRDGAWTPPLPAADPSAALALVFGPPALMEDPARLGEIGRAFPAAHRLGCSTAGEILGTEVTDDTLTCTAVTFAHTRVRVVAVPAPSGGGEHSGPPPATGRGAGAARAACGSAASAALPAGARTPERAGGEPSGGGEQSGPPPATDDGEAVGRAVARALAGDGLRHVLVFAAGPRVNGSALARGLQSALPAGVTVTGGLAADGDRFGRTLVLGEAPCDTGVVAAGFYGARLRVGFGSLGGWDPFGPERLVTRAAGNVCFELDGEPALDLYRRYLGPHAAGLPASGLRFPLSVRLPDSGARVVRTLLAVDDARRSVTFAGDIPQGSRAQLMKANFDRLIDGAMRAAEASHVPLRGSAPALAVLVSCVGRKLVLQQRVEEEVEAVRDVLGPAAALTGFYSYGELAPLLEPASCQLHNQTMTITTLAEA